MSSPILYFGCLGDTGHYLWTKVHGYLAREGRGPIGLRVATPWGFNLDGGIMKGSARVYHAGVVHHAQKDEWTAISIPDYSVDSRPGSHSTFCAKGVFDMTQMVTMAQAQWPEVFGRARFPKLILP